VRLLVDMNLSPRWCGLPNAAGMEAAHWSDVGVATAPDETIMAFARTEAWVVLTKDFDLLLAASLRDGPSVVQFRSRHTNPDVHGPAVVRAIRWAAAELERAALLTIDPDY
jgi:predicted nuclease of predicted toxin-antitoxin system